MQSVPAGTSATSAKTSTKTNGQLEVLGRYGLIGSGLEESFDHITRLAACLFEAPISLVSFVGEDRYWVKSAQGIEKGRAELCGSFCVHAIRSEGTTVIEDATEDKRFSSNRLVTGEPGIRFYAGAPLVILDGCRVGTLCVLDRRPRSPSTGLLGRLEDLAEVVMDELELRRAKGELRRQNERLGSFASVLSHDLRNPLTVAMGRLSIAREEFTHEEGGSIYEGESDEGKSHGRNSHGEGPASHLQSHLDAASRALVRMNQIIEDVLTLTWGSQKIDEESLEVCSLEEVARASWEHVDTAHAELQVEDSLSFRANVSRLKQLLENLFRNAVDHGGEEVTVRLGALRLEALLGGFYVEDDGPGIPPKRRKQIFEMGETTNEGGTGLGLSIADTIAEAHGWSLSAEEGREGGARFEITGVDVEEPTSTENLKG